MDIQPVVASYNPQLVLCIIPELITVLKSLYAAVASEKVQCFCCLYSYITDCFSEETSLNLYSDLINTVPYANIKACICKKKYKENSGNEDCEVFWGLLQLKQLKEDDRFLFLVI
jgi:hypothetical protein